jgi:hypothetical protein
MMQANNYSAQDIVLILGALTTMIATIIGAIYSKRSSHSSEAARSEASTANQKVETKSTIITDRLDTIEAQTNGNISELRVKLRASNDTNNHLIDVITCLVDMLPTGSLTKARQELEKLKASIGYRRSTDALTTDADFSRKNLEELTERTDGRLP